MDSASDLTRLRHAFERVGDLVTDETLLGAMAPEVSSWSVARQAHHTLLVASSVATGIRGILRGRGEEGAETSVQARELLAGGEIPRGVAKAPAVFEPDEDPQPDTLRGLLAKTRSRWDALEGQAEKIGAATGHLPHPLLGPLAAAEWVRFAAVHTDHHLGIVGEILGE